MYRWTTGHIVDPFIDQRRLVLCKTSVFWSADGRHMRSSGPGGPLRFVVESSLVEATADREERRRDVTVM